MTETPSHPLFAAVYDPFMAAAERTVFPPHRDYLTDVSGTVLDVGSGTGANFPYYAERAVEVDLTLHGVEPDPHMARRARRRAGRLGLDVDLREAPAESLPFEDDTFDAVVVGICFCTVEDPERALDELARVLKPGGELRFLEHVRDGGLVGMGQSLVEPAWKRVAGGCHVTRDTAALFAGHPAFETVEMERVDVGVFPADPFVRGTLRRRS